MRPGEQQPYFIHRSSLPIDRIAPLRLEDILDIDHCWLKDCYSRQPGVFYSREIIERIGGLVSEHYARAIDYEWWVRCAEAGALAFAQPEILALSLDQPVTQAEQSVMISELRAVAAAHQTHKT